MTAKLSDTRERISLEDLAVTGLLLEEILEICNCRTYDLFITSDSDTHREETHS